MDIAIRPAHPGGATPSRTRLGSAAQAAKEGVVDGFFSNTALPSFLYPAVSGTAAERAVAFAQLDRLPLHDVSSASAVRFVGNLPTDVAGASRPGLLDIQIAHGLSPAETQLTLTHELGHTHDFASGPFHILPGYSGGNSPFGHAPYVTSYAETSRQEDFAETYTRYQMEHGHLASDPAYGPMSDAKHQVVQRSEQLNFMEKLVDQRPFRETGREIGQVTSSVPFLRMGLSFLSSVSGFMLITDGATNLLSGFKDGDRVKESMGLLNLGAGLALGFTAASPLLGPAALALLGARRGIKKACDSAANAPDNKLTVAAAVGGALGGMVGGVAGPLGGTCLGFAIGGPVGGAIGLVTGSILGLRVLSPLGAKVAMKLAA